VVKDKREKSDGKVDGTFDPKRFEQEVAEEIGISLDRTLGKAGRRSKTGGPSSPSPDPNNADRGNEGRRGDSGRDGETKKAGPDRGSPKN
jgi:hypothetical protein